MINIIANPKSGKGNGKSCLEKATAVLNELLIPYTINLTNDVGHGSELAKTLCESSNEGDVLVALGGDGTFHEVLNGVDFNKTRLGLIPSGRGNDFAKGTHATSLDPQKAMHDIIHGEPLDLDYIQVSDKRCINIGGTGLDVDVLQKTAKSRNKLSYIASLFRCLLKFEPYKVTATVNGESTDYSCIMIGVCNGTQFGGGIKLSPLSKPDDGLLDVIVMEKPKRCPTIFIMPKFVKGKHMGKPYTKHIRCESIKIETTAPVELDGEIYNDLVFDAHVVKGGLKTFAQQK